MMMSFEVSLRWWGIEGVVPRGPDEGQLDRGRQPPDDAFSSYRDPPHLKDLAVPHPVKGLVQNPL